MIINITHIFDNSHIFKISATFMKHLKIEHS